MCNFAIPRGTNYGSRRREISGHNGRMTLSAVTCAGLSQSGLSCIAGYPLGGYVAFMKEFV